MRILFFLLINLTAMAQPVTLTVKNMSITVDVNTGARITSLKADGGEILGSSTIHPRFYGSSLWLSPEGKWKGMGGLDTGPYTVEIKDPTSLKVTCEPDSLRGFSFTKEFRVHAADTSVTIRYTITNTAGQQQEVAPWEVSRVPTGGLAFFPAGSTAALTRSDLTVRDTLGYIWYPYDSASKQHQKLYRHGAEGWTAYVKGGVLFLKRYPIADRPAPGEENVEIYVNPEKTYIELENQGPYQSLASGASLSYEVKWYARRLPPNIGANIGSASLIAYVRTIINAR